jgi:hypothetical protein
MALLQLWRRPGIGVGCGVAASLPGLRLRQPGQLTCKLNKLVVKQESSTNLVEQVDELKRKTEKTEREFEEFKIQQQEEYNKLREDIMRFSSSSGNSQSSTLLA